MSNPPKKFLVVNADDFGLAPQTNKAIGEAHKYGILTSTSLLATCPGFTHARSISKSNPKLGLGVHLSLTLGVPVLSPGDVPILTQADGAFIPSYRHFLFRADKAIIRQIELEFVAQIEKCLKSGFSLHHIDSQSHIHMVPHIFRITLKLAARYRIKYVRLSKDRLYTAGSIAETFRPYLNTNIIKLVLLNTLSQTNETSLARLRTVRSADAYYGVTHTGNMNETVLHSILDRVGPGTTEISLHPGFSVNDTAFDFRSQYMHDFMISPYRRTELAALKDSGILRHIRRSAIILTNFRRLSV